MRRKVILTFQEAIKEVARILGKSIDTKPIKANKNEYIFPKIETRPLTKKWLTTWLEGK